MVCYAHYTYIIMQYYFTTTHPHTPWSKWIFAPCLTRLSAQKNNGSIASHKWTKQFNMGVRLGALIVYIPVPVAGLNP
jgi:hypothetical protein